MNNIERMIREKAYVAQRKKYNKKQKMPTKTLLLDKKPPKTHNITAYNTSFINKKLIGAVCIVLAAILLLAQCSADKPKKNEAKQTGMETAAPTMQVVTITKESKQADEMANAPSKPIEDIREPSSGAEDGISNKQSVNTQYDTYLQGFKIEPKILKKIFKESTRSEQAFAKSLAIWSIESFKATKEKDIFKIIHNSTNEDVLFTTELYKRTFEIYNQFVYDIKCFPIPKGYRYTFENSWGAPRDYNGKRVHYGIDIMEPKNKDATTKIISMTDGVVENIGWNELGGYRVGIRSEGGAYFYYAHLAKLPTHIKKGDPVRAGDYIGLMGNTGYGIEGTSGKFPVHLHVGISVTTPENKEFWINPYYLLRYIENKRIRVFTM
ncbi:MAG: M23 family metallopeptidase [Cellulosilyticaceae bacterium]